MSLVRLRLAAAVCFPLDQGMIVVVIRLWRWLILTYGHFNTDTEHLFEVVLHCQPNQF